MGHSRLYVGGLGGKVDENALNNQFSKYGAVSTIDLKEKKDAEGNLLTRFAYISIDASREQILKCVETLNGTSWLGSKLKVEQAKESFIDKLKRERASTAPTLPKKRVELQPIQKEVNQEYATELQQFKQKFNSKTNKSPKKKRKRDSSLSDSEEQHRSGIPMFSGTQSLDSKNTIDQSKDDSPVKKKKSKKTKVNPEEEKMLVDFKQFSSVWGDSDEEESNHSSAIKHKPEEEKEDVVETSDCNEPSRDAVDKNEESSNSDAVVISKYVKIKPDLKFEKKSSEFSFLSQFTHNDQAEKPESFQNVVSSDEVYAISRPEKSRNFFIAPNDPMIEAGAKWMAQGLGPEVIDAFKEERDEIMEVCKTRVARVKQALRNKKPFKRHKWDAVKKIKSL